MKNAVILSTGAYVPEQVLSNAYFDKHLGIDVSTWLEENANIFERHWCREDEATSDLCVAAAQQALERAGVRPEQLDLLIIATDTPDYVSPATSAVVQHRLGATRAGVFDLNTACAGFVTALDTASMHLRAKPNYQYALVIGAYAMSKYLNLEDKKTVTLFADGAGAVVLGTEETEERGYLASHLHAMGQYYDGMGIYAGGSRQPVTETVIEHRDHQLKFVYRFPAELNKEEWSKMILNLCEQTGTTPQEVDRFFITQININSLRDTMDHLGLPQEKAHTIMDRYAYTGSACIPMAFNDAVERGLVKRGDLVHFVGSGGGLTFAAAAFRY
jgi:3-oxoacyl-[acyl-carrier-protein] synthase III